jgi:gamma-glutamyltranspeptidase/glutathione hydrolase
LSKRTLKGRLPLARLLEDAIHYAEQGIAVTASQALNTANKQAELAPQPGFNQTFLVRGAAPVAGSIFVQKRMGATLRRIGSPRLIGRPTFPPPQQTANDQ